MKNQGAARYRITVFGELSVAGPEGEVSRFTTRRVAALLAYIALRPERVHTREVLTEALWPEEDPEKTRPRLRQTLALLKKDLAVGGIELEQLLIINRLELRLNTDQAATDFGELHSLLRATRIAETLAHRQILSERVRELAAEELLPNFYDEWVLQARQSVQAALDAAPLPSEAQVLPRQNPEPPTAFFGRDADLDRLRLLLVPGALVTLTAMGGMGKTRLALELARQEPESVFVSLVDLTEYAPFAPALAKALGLSSAALGSDPLATILLQLRAHPSLLLILDNAEHLIQPVTQLVQHLRQDLPGLRLLVTSRHRLGLSAEQELTLSPLPIHSDALALFVNRAQLAQQGFSCTPQNEALLTRLCTRLDGIPLALEMAAAWLAVLTPEQILARLERRFSLLVSRQTDTPTRQQSLFQVIESSVALLPSPVRALLGNLTIFCGGWTVEAAEEICGAGLLEGLALLRERALIQSVRGQDLARFRMLETIREFSLSLPRDTPLGERHARYYARQAEAERAHLSQTTETASLNRIEEDHENFTAALDYLTHHDLEAALQLACALDHFWILRGYLDEGRGRFSALLAQPGGRATARAWALRSATLLSHYQGDHATAMKQAEAALALFELSEDQRGIDWTQSVLATAALELGHYARAEQLFLATLEQPTLSPLAKASVLLRLGLLNYARGDYARSAALCREGWGIAQTCQSPRNVLGLMQQLAMALRELGALEEALHLLTDVRTQARELQLNASLPGTLQELASTLALLGRYSEVHVALREAVELWTELGNPTRSARALTLKAQVLLETGAPEEARRSAQQVVTLLSAEREPRSVALALDLVAWLTFMPEEAAQLVGAADALYEQTHYPRRPTQQPKANELRQRLLNTLGSDSLRENLVGGSALTIREALALASRCLLLPSDKKIFR